MPSSVPDPTSLVPILDGLPGPWSLLAVLLYITFVLHLLLVNAVVGVSAITLIDRLRSGPDLLRRADLRDQSILLPKGVALAVNFAVPPLLFLQGIYGQFIYPGAILSALWSLSLMAVAMLAYYGLYINMAQSGLSDRVRTTALTISLLLLLASAFLLVNLSTLMQNPERWAAPGRAISGLFVNLGDPQFIPRYLHILLSCLAVGGLCIALPARYRSDRLEPSAPETESQYLHEREAAGLSWFFYATLLQLPVGGWFFHSLPQAQRKLFMGEDPTAAALMFLSLFLAGFALFAARRGRSLVAAVSALLTVCFMAGMRTLLRASLLEEHYQPALRPFEAGPFFLFAASLAASALIVVWLIAVYRRQAMLPMLEETDAGTPAGQPEARVVPVPDQPRPAYDHDAVLVNEIAMGRADRDEQAAADRGENVTPHGGNRS